jgi:hypothetical protein
VAEPLAEELIEDLAGAYDLVSQAEVNGVTVAAVFATPDGRFFRVTGATAADVAAAYAEPGERPAPQEAEREAAR